jgi:hypothetical protein
MTDLIVQPGAPLVPAAPTPPVQQDDEALEALLADHQRALRLLAENERMRALLLRFREAAVSPDVVLGLIDEVLTSRRRIGALTTLTDAQTARLQSYMNDGAKRAEAINTLASEREANALLTDEIERLRADRDDVRAELTNLQIAFNDWKVTHSTVRLEVEIERLRAALDALGVAIADAGYTWTPEMRAAYEKGEK